MRSYIYQPIGCHITAKAPAAKIQQLPAVTLYGAGGCHRALLNCIIEHLLLLWTRMKNTEGWALHCQQFSVAQCCQQQCFCGNSSEWGCQLEPPNSLVPCIPHCLPPLIDKSFRMSWEGVPFLSICYFSSTWIPVCGNCIFFHGAFLVQIKLQKK